MSSNQRNGISFFSRSAESFTPRPNNHPAAKTVISKIGANGRADWAGWIEFDRDAFESRAVENTARVIAEVNADILCLVEVESRPALVQFNKRFLKPGHRYGYKLLIDGNERLGIYSKTIFGGEYPHFDTVTSEGTQASDHAAVWADFAL